MKATSLLAVTRPSLAQRGAASVGIAILIVLLMGAALSTALSLSGSVARDAAAADQQAQALFIAESGMERATQRFVAGGVACASLGDGTTTFTIGTAGSFVISAGMNTKFDGVTSSGTSCRVRVTGTTTNGQVVRVIESVLDQAMPPPDAVADFDCTVPAGANRLLVVSVSWTSDSVVSIQGVTFLGARMTAVDAGARNVGSDVYSAQNFYLVNPTVGSNVDGSIALVGATDHNDKVVVGCHAFTGVDGSHPIESFQSLSGVGSDGNPFGVTITTGATNTSGFVIDNLARDNGSSMDMVASAAPFRVERWNTPSSHRASARSYRGPILTPGTATDMKWTLDGKKWATTALAVQAATMTLPEMSTVDVHNPTGGSAGGSAGGLGAWREVTVPPL